MSEIVKNRDRLEFLSYVKERVKYDSKSLKRFNSYLKRISFSMDINKPESVDSRKKTHSPHKMVEFLSLFSKDDDFKWYTHRWDQQGLTLDSMVSTQKSKKSLLYKMVYDSYYPVNERTYYQVWNFINFDANPEKNYWIDNSGEKQSIGWNSIVGLNSQKPEISVENIMLADGHLFKDYIRKFKSSIEFRTDLDENDRFSEFVRRAIRQFINGAIRVKYSDNFDDIGYDINIYCDVVGLRKALETVCAWMVKHKASGSGVVVDLISDKDGYELVIFQEGSYFTNLEKLENPSGDFDALRKRLFSVCDFKVEGDFKVNRQDSGSLVVHALDNTSERLGDKMNPCAIEHKDETIGGVRYTFKLYK